VIVAARRPGRGPMGSQHQQQRQPEESPT
jgi:hypothetical protein